MNETMRETIITKLDNLPDSVLQQVNDFIDLVSLCKQNQMDDRAQKEIREAWKQ